MDADIVKSLIAANVTDLKVVSFNWFGGMLVRAADGSEFVISVRQSLKAKT